MAFDLFCSQFKDSVGACHHRRVQGVGMDPSDKSVNYDSSFCNKPRNPCSIELEETLFVGRLYYFGNVVEKSNASWRPQVRDLLEIRLMSDMLRDGKWYFSVDWRPVLKVNASERTKRSSVSKGDVSKPCLRKFSRTSDSCLEVDMYRTSVPFRSIPATRFKTSINHCESASNMNTRTCPAFTGRRSSCPITGNFICTALSDSAVN